MNKERLLQRFLRYVDVDSTANEASSTYPSSPGQLELGRLLVEELSDLGLSDASQDEHGLVTATIPATIDARAPVIVFCSHLDTSPETSGAGVKPQVIHDYLGGDLVLPGDRNQIIRVRDNAELESLIGKSLVTTDGTTLLGGDDKAGVAIIVETAAHLLEHPEVPHGDVRILFTCDEEIGKGVEHVDVAKMAATVCYTLDGPAAGQVDVETFSADMAVIQFVGINIHPAIAKGRMVNAIRAAGDFVARLPRGEMSPETSSGKEGFMHPYAIEGGTATAQLRVLLRDFETEALARQIDLLQKTANEVQREFPGLEIKINVIPQYRNLRDGLSREPRAVKFVQEAYRRLNKTANLTSIRGGTDGSVLTERGLPTPNLSSGQHNPHSPLEWVCLDEMVEAVQLLVQLVEVWAEDACTSR